MPGSIWSFRSNLVRDVVYERLTKTDRAYRHAGIAAWIEANKVGGGAAAIGYHYRQAAYLARELGGLEGMGSDLDDVTSGFRVISQPLLRKFAVNYPTEYLGDTVEAILLAHKHGASVTQVPVDMAPRVAGSSVSRVHAAGQLARVLFAMAVRSWGRSTS